jgi:thiamine-phosphate pyrophosphorylase
MERAGCRIIDANFNRAREALRVIEDYCRFNLNCSLLSGRAKQMRHQLSSTIAQLDAGKLLASRDTLGDVGTNLVIEKPIGRADLKDSLTAACKRLPEALRVITETLRTENPAIADQVESLRYSSYTLEKDITLFADASARFSKVRLYVLICSELPAEVFALTAQCIAGGVDCLQLRAKNIDADKFFAIASEFVKMCKDAGVISIINDRADIAIASGADGVHLGQSDLPIEQARKMQMKPMILGKSTTTLAQLKAAIAELPTYVGLGAVFATPTKPDAEVVGLEYIKQALPILTDTGIGHAAIGGINESNIEALLAAGVRTFAISSAVTNSSEPAAACRKLKRIITAFLDKQ